MLEVEVSNLRSLLSLCILLKVTVFKRFLELKLLCCVCINEQANVPIQQQQLLYNGNEMRNSDKLSALGVKDDDLLMMMVSNASSGYGPLKLATLLLDISM